MLRRPVGSTLAIAAGSALLWPAAWMEWLGLLVDSAEMHGRPGTLAVAVLYRLPVAAAIVVLAGWRDWRWMLPVGVLVAMPQIGPSASVILLAIPRLMWSGADGGRSHRLSGLRDLASHQRQGEAHGPQTDGAERNRGSHAQPQVERDAK